METVINWDLVIWFNVAQSRTLTLCLCDSQWRLMWLKCNCTQVHSLLKMCLLTPHIRTRHTHVASLASIKWLLLSALISPALLLWTHWVRRASVESGWSTLVLIHSCSLLFLTVPPAGTDVKSKALFRALYVVFLLWNCEDNRLFGTSLSQQFYHTHIMI